MQIHELDAVGTLQDSDVVALDDGTTTYKTGIGIIADHIANVAKWTMGGSSRTIVAAIKTLFSNDTTTNANLSTLQSQARCSNNGTVTVGTTNHKAVLSGFVTASNKIYLDVPIEKSTAYVHNVTVSELTGRIRGVQGVLNNDSSDINYTSSSAYTINSAICGSGHVLIAITADSNFTNCVNNSTVCYYGSCVLSFTS